MDDEDGYFGERMAAAYDQESAGMFEPAAVDSAVGVLTGPAGRRPGYPQARTRCGRSVTTTRDSPGLSMSRRSDWYLAPSLPAKA